MDNKNKNCALKKKQGGTTKDKKETLQRWTRHIQEHFPIPGKQETPLMQHIREETWKQKNIQENDIHPDIKTIRGNAKLTQLMKTEQYIAHWLTSEYTEKEVKKHPRNSRTIKHTEVMESQEKHTKYLRHG